MEEGEPLKRGLLSWLRNEPNNYYLSAKSKKFQVPPTEIDMEKFITSITPQKAQKKHYIEEYIKNAEKSNAGNDSALAALNMWRINLLKDGVDAEADEKFAIGFYKWLKGDGSKEDHDKTPWGRSKIRDNEVLDYIGIFLEAKIDFQNKLFKLSQAHKLGGLRGLNEYYLFFKYIVRRSDHLDNSSFLQDYNLLWRPDTKERVEIQPSYEFPEKNEKKAEDEIEEKFAMEVEDKIKKGEDLVINLNKEKEEEEKKRKEKELSEEKKEKEKKEFDDLAKLIDEEIAGLPKRPELEIPKQPEPEIPKIDEKEEKIKNLEKELAELKNERIETQKKAVEKEQEALAAAQKMRLSEKSFALQKQKQETRIKTVTQALENKKIETKKLMDINKALETKYESLSKEEKTKFEAERKFLNDKIIENKNYVNSQLSAMKTQNENEKKEIEKAYGTILASRTEEIVTKAHLEVSQAKDKLMVDFETAKKNYHDDYITKERELVKQQTFLKYDFNRTVNEKVKEKITKDLEELKQERLKMEEDKKKFERDVYTHYNNEYHLFIQNKEANEALEERLKIGAASAIDVEEVSMEIEEKNKLREIEESTAQKQKELEQEEYLKKGREGAIDVEAQAERKLTETLKSTMEKLNASIVEKERLAKGGESAIDVEVEERERELKEIARATYLKLKAAREKREEEERLKKGRESAIDVDEPEIEILKSSKPTLEERLKKGAETAIDVDAPKEIKEVLGKPRSLTSKQFQKLYEDTAAAVNKELKKYNEKINIEAPLKEIFGKPRMVDKNQLEEIFDALQTKILSKYFKGTKESPLIIDDLPNNPELITPKTSKRKQESTPLYTPNSTIYDKSGKEIGYIDHKGFPREMPDEGGELIPIEKFNKMQKKIEPPLKRPRSKYKMVSVQ